MSGVQPFYRFHFDQHLAVDQQVDPESGVKAQAIKYDIDRLLPMDLITKLCEPAGEHHLVNGLEQTWSELAVYSNRLVENVSADFINGFHARGPFASLRLCARKEDPAGLD
jgi:hypothetical protein